jgi:hypothetical protein
VGPEFVTSWIISKLSTPNAPQRRLVQAIRIAEELARSELGYGSTDDFVRALAEAAGLSLPVRHVLRH